MFLVLTWLFVMQFGLVVEICKLGQDMLVISESRKLTTLKFLGAWRSWKQFKVDAAAVATVAAAAAAAAEVAVAAAAAAAVAAVVAAATAAVLH